jgi:hypothetical protein
MSRLKQLEVNGRLPTAFWVDAGLKGVLVLLLLLPLLFADLEQYDGKGMSWRLLVYPLAGFIIPLLWLTTGSRPPYPYLADNLVILPAIADVVWNTLDAYDRLDRWDDVNHLVNAMIFSAVIGLWAARYPLGAVTRYRSRCSGRSASTWCSSRTRRTTPASTRTRSATSRSGSSDRFSARHSPSGQSPGTSVKPSSSPRRACSSDRRRRYRLASAKPGMMSRP